MKFSAIIGAIFASVLLSGQAASAGKVTVTGDCRDFSFIEKFGGQTKVEYLEDGHAVRILRHNAPVYRNQSGQEVVFEAAFSDFANVVEVETLDELPEERVSVSFIFGNDQNAYWMDRTDLHCQRYPLIDETTRLERKALIRTKTTERQDGVVQAITAFRTPELKETPGTSERKLSRFRTYLIYGEAPNAFLLGEHFNLSNSEKKLVGWVDKKNVLNWNWAIGLRPNENLKNGDGSVGSICGYDSLQPGAECIPILGGNSWFKSNLRLPVLEVTDTHYKVAGAASGIAGEVGEDGKLRISRQALSSLSINPSETEGIDEEKIRSFNQIDVFFLIDGTKSMGPFIDGIRGTASRPGVIRTIVREIEERRSGSSIRVGFRVFRDSKKGGAAGIDESYKLGNTECDSDNKEVRRRERERFERRLESIQTTVDDKDDFDENLLGGLKTAARDIIGCPNRQKLIFVISDAGYDPEVQAKRGHEPLYPDEVLSKLLGLDKVTLYFLRTPKRPRREFKSDRSFEKYHESWEEYRLYGEYLISEVLARDHDSNSPRPRMSDYFFDIGGGSSSIENMLDKIIGSIKSVARPEIVNDILIDLRGGAALENIIKRLQRENEDVPVLYWNMLRRTACQDSEETCRQRIYDGVFDMYVPKTEKPVLEAWMNYNRLDEWVELLDHLEDVADVSGRKKEREAMSMALRNSMATVLKMPPPEMLDETIDKYLQRGGFLPGPIKTPFLGYTFNQISRPDQMPACELDRLRQWITTSQRMLENVLRSNELSYYEPGKARECVGMTENGKRIKYIAGKMTSRPPNENDTRNYTLGKDHLGETIYWVPHEYLP